MTLIEAAKQARNMLEHIDLQDAERDFLTTGECEELDRIIELINQAIANAEQWQGLTDEEKQEWIDAMPSDPQPRHCMILANVIESKLKEKNT